jgi:putative ABC transport system permease protein
MKELVARDQVRLGLRRCFQLALSGMSHRLFRASVTIAILALAVAFLAHMLTFSVIERETRRSAAAELRSSRALGEIVSRVSAPDAPRTIIAGLAGDDAGRLHEYEVWSGLTPDEFARVRTIARAFQHFDDYVSSANPAQRAALFGDQSAAEACSSLSEPEEFRHFLAQVRSFGLRLPLGGEAELKAFLFSDRAVLAAGVAAIHAGHTRAIAALVARFSDALQAAASDPAPANLFERPPPGLLAAAAQQGFDTSSWSLAALQAFAGRARERARLEHAIVRGPSAELSRELDVPVSELSLRLLFSALDGDLGRAGSVSKILARAGFTDFDAAKLASLATDNLRVERLDRAAGNAAPTTTAWFGISVRNCWLVLLSFLVCGVGVANAMLMSVGERFAEIATMKCLGALDGFVMVLFLLEAAIQGVIGGIVGLILGGLLALGRGLAEYGTLLGSARGALGQTLLALAVALALGVLLAALSAVGPSFVAARLSPMEAMRID